MVLDLIIHQVEVVGVVDEVVVDIVDDDEVDDEDIDGKFNF
jgi:hypothetical protein